MRKKLAIILALLFILPLAACSGGGSTSAPAQTAGGETAVATETAEPETTVITPDIPDTNWEGRVFRVLGDGGQATKQFANFEIATDALNGEIYNDALYERNANLSEQYNVKFEMIGTTSNHSTHSALSSAVNAGEDLYDLVFVEVQHIGSQAQQGYYYNMNNVKYIDFTKPWWNPDVNDSTSIGGKVYFTSSDYSLRDKNRAYIMLFNPEIAEDHKLPDLIKTIRDGKWTIDLMTQYCETVAQDLNGDGALQDSDNWGIVMDSYNSFNAFWFGLDNNTILKNENGEPYIAMNAEHAFDSIDKCLKVLCTPRVGGFCEDSTSFVTYDKWDFSYYAFCNGHALFTTTFPHGLASRSEEAEFEYTVIPFPKFNEEQAKYLTMPDVMSMLFAIPVTLKDTDFTGFMLEALSYASTDTTLHTYYDVVCKSKYSANAVSAEMMDIIFDGIRYDLDKIYNIGLYNYIQGPARSKENTFASAFASYKETAENKLKDLVDTIGKLEY